MMETAVFCVMICLYTAIIYGIGHRHGYIDAMDYANWLLDHIDELEDEDGLRTVSN